MDGQISIFDFCEKELEPDKKEQSTINFSCFAVFRSEAGGVRYGKCVADHKCQYCDTYIKFYEKAEEFQKAGNSWGKSVALAKSFWGIPNVPEYEIEAYQ